MVNNTNCEDLEKRIKEIEKESIELKWANRNCWNRPPFLKFSA